MTQEPKHSPLPWIIESLEDDPDHTYNVIPGNAHPDIWGVKKTILSDERYYPTAPSKEDAKFIVTACNSHYQLLEALESLKTQVKNVLLPKLNQLGAQQDFIESFNLDVVADKVDKALSQARGEK